MKIEKISKRWQRISLTDTEHVPVMCKEIIEYLKPASKKWIVDCTIGLGGHALNILEHMPSDGKLIGIDKDEESLSMARERLKGFETRFNLFHADFSEIDSVLDEAGINSVDGALFDLGISMYQVSSYQRGFSFMREGPLDMRMNRNAFISAYDLVNNLSEKELDYIFREYGQERWHRRIAHRIVEERKFSPISTTSRLADVIAKAVRNRSHKFSTHPATRAFQALRIAVNRELDSLRIGLEKVLNRLSKGARVCVLSFHSLEDKIVKETFKKFEVREGFCRVNSSVLKPSYLETKLNVRSRSAKLRVIERL